MGGGGGGNLYVKILHTNLYSGCYHVGDIVHVSSCDTFSLNSLSENGIGTGIVAGVRHNIIISMFMWFRAVFTTACNNYWFKHGLQTPILWTLALF